MKSENFLYSWGSSPQDVSKLDTNEEDSKNNVWQFGDIGIFCAWWPAREPQAVTLNTSRESQLSDALAQTVANTGVDPGATKAKKAGVVRFTLTEDDIPLTIWRAKRINAVHPKTEGMFTFSDLRIIIPQLIVAARDKVAPKGVPLYYLLYIGEVNKTTKPLTWMASRVRREENTSATGGLAGRPLMDSETFRQFLEMLREIRVEMDLATVVEKNSSAYVDDLLIDTTYFEHYSPLRRSRGYIVLDPRFSIVIDCAEEDIRSLLTIVQQVNLTHQGLQAPGFARVLLRVSMWDSSSDVHASLDDLVQISRSNDASTQGQVLLSFALAGIGILLALTPLPNVRPGQLVAPMLLYAMAAIVHGFFALTGKRFFNLLGALCLLLATALAIIIFVVPSFVIPFLPTHP
jgi:hypothetical protein